MECEKFKQLHKLEANCCYSCHEDNDIGFGDDLWFIVDGKDWNICCLMMVAYELRLIKEANKISK